tara:strand:+ start:208 stop:1395 length:1188 start_codon:yes stop_codon:yes gene_type:complete
MKKRKRKKKIKRKKNKKRKNLKNHKRRNNRLRKTRNKGKKKKYKIKKKRNKIKYLKSKKHKTSYTKKIILNVLRLNVKFKSIFKFNINLDRSLQNFFQGISNKILEIKKVIREEKEKQNLLKIKAIEKERKELQERLKKEKENQLKSIEIELKEEIKLEKKRKKELQKFIRIEQAEVRKEQANKQRKFLEQIKLEKKIEQFRKREALEINNLEKYVLSQQRESYLDVQQRIDKIKEKYQALRDQKIRERVEQLGVKVEEGDDRIILLEKERAYNLERQKIEFALESFYRSAHSLCFQINKKYIPKYLSIMRVIDRRFETGEIFIKWDDVPDEDWLILIYIKNNSPDEGIIIEDKTDPDQNKSYEFKSNEIFKASDLMVDALTKLLDRERNKKKAS